MSYELRPLSLAELLDRAFGIYRRHLLLFVGILALPSMANIALQVSLQLVNPPVPPAPDTPPDPELMLGAALWMFGVSALLTTVYLFTYAVALGAATFAVSRIYEGESPTIAGTYGALRGKVGRLAWLVLQVFVRLGGMMAIGMALAGVVGGVFMVVFPVLGAFVMVTGFLVSAAVLVWMMLRYTIAVPPAVLEDRTAFESIRRSIALTRGHLWRALVLLLFTVIVNYAALALFQGPFWAAAVVAGLESRTGFLLNLCGVVTGGIAAALTSPLAVVAMAVFYYDLRIRKEGFDLQVLIDGLGGESAPATPPEPRGGSLFLPG